jgi:hypothetical protein
MEYDVRPHHLEHVAYSFRLSTVKLYPLNFMTLARDPRRSPNARSSPHKSRGKMKPEKAGRSGDEYSLIRPSVRASISH